jgi:hypothetical protein
MFETGNDKKFDSFLKMYLEDKKQREKEAIEARRKEERMERERKEEKEENRK